MGNVTQQHFLEKPRFKGIAYCTRHQDDVQRVKDVLKDKPFSQWAEVLRSTFNNDSVLRIRAEKGLFKKGMNALVDKEIFGKDTTAAPVKDYPYTAVYGHEISAPEELDDMRAFRSVMNIGGTLVLSGFYELITPDISRFSVVAYG